MFHSDRGVQYTAMAFRLLLNQKGFLQSMTSLAVSPCETDPLGRSPKASAWGDPYDNAVAENFFSCLKSS